MYNTKTSITIPKSRKHKKHRKLKKILKVFILAAILFIISIIAVKYIIKSNSFEGDKKYGVDYLYDQKYLQYNYKIISTLNKKTGNNIDDTDLENPENNDNQNDYNSVVPESEAVTDDFFNDAVFIGDSRTEGFILYNGLSNVTSLTAKGLMVDTAFTRPAINMNGEKLTVMKALSKIKFNKVYIMLGINELGWAYSDIFIKKYAEIVDYIKEINSEAQIYVQSILPVSYEKSSSDKIYNNNNISNYNKLILEMTKDKQVYYLDVAEDIKDEDGNLPVDASLDGIHLKKEYCQKWFEYLKTHTVQSKIVEEGDN